MKNKLVILVISLIMLLTSCSVSPDNQGSTTPPEERKYISADVTYSESTAQYAFRLNMDTTETDSAKYFFEESIENKDREACIEVTDKVLSHLTLDEVVPEIYIFSNDRYSYKNISEHKFYCSIQDWKSVEYITDVLLVAYGESAHYGTAFGYANYLSKNYNWKSYESQFSNPSVSDTFDLNYLCFNESFTTSNDIAVAKGIACAFVDAYINRHGEQAFQQLLSASSKSTNALASYYAENGVSYTPSTVQYGGSIINVGVTNRYSEKKQ